jgi:hypothetical protein
MLPTKPAHKKPKKGLPVVTDTAKAVSAVINKVPSMDKLITPDFSVIVSPITTKIIGVLRDIIVTTEDSKGSISTPF